MSNVQCPSSLGTKTIRNLFAIHFLLLLLKLCFNLKHEKKKHQPIWKYGQCFFRAKIHEQCHDNEFAVLMTFDDECMRSENT